MVIAKKQYKVSMNHLPQVSPPENCPCCGSTFQGNFCHKCGEKQVSVEDFKLSKYAQTLAQHFTHLDSKLLRSLRFLVTKPGFLTAEYVAGKRNLYVLPLQLFFLVNLAFFLFLGENDIFAPKLTYIYYTDYQIWNGEKVKDIADTFALNRGISIETAIEAIDTKSSNLAKGLLYLFVPMLGTAFFGLFYRQNPFFLCHLVFATHWLALWMFILMVGGSFVFFLFKLKGPLLLLVLLTMLLPLHFLATRRFFGGSWFWLLIKALTLFVLFVGQFLIYREFVLFLTLKTL